MHRNSSSLYSTACRALYHWRRPVRGGFGPSCLALFAQPACFLRGLLMAHQIHVLLTRLFAVVIG
jgi:hypothetical protein